MYLLDTTIFSFMLRDDSRLELYDGELNASTPFFLSAMTVCELESGAEIDGWGLKRRGEMRRHMERFTILAIDESFGKPYGQAMALSRAAGQSLTPPDALILAAAKRFDLVVITHDRDMLISEQLGVKVICRA